MLLYYIIIIKYFSYNKNKNEQKRKIKTEFTKRSKSNRILQLHTRKYLIIKI